MRLRLLAITVPLCLVVSSCTPSGPPPSRAADVDRAAVERGRQVYEAEACSACHGERGEGTEVAPSLAGLARHWQRGELAAFLVDPGPALASDARLQGMAARWDLEMPGVASASPEDAQDLALYLLHGLE